MQLNVHISAIAAGISIGFVLVVLLVSLWVWSVPQARGYLQRLSFRLLLYSMVWETVYDVSYICVSAGLATFFTCHRPPVRSLAKHTPIARDLRLDCGSGILRSMARGRRVALGGPGHESDAGA
jgi:hypothetical protein